jgi:HNH endonuclease
MVEDIPEVNALSGRLLCRCHRRCCICHRFCRVKIETDHMVPTEDGGDDTIDNAIPVCFECHAEIHTYNDKHPRGRKFRPNELRLHKEQWLRICDQHPEALIGAVRTADVGPLRP